MGVLMNRERRMELEVNSLWKWLPILGLVSCSVRTIWENVHTGGLIGRGHHCQLSWQVSSCLRCWRSSQSAFTLDQKSYLPAKGYWDVCRASLSDTGSGRLQEGTRVCWELISLVTKQNMCVPIVLCNHFISCSIYIYWTHSASSHYSRSQAFKDE